MVKPSENTLSVLVFLFGWVFSTRYLAVTLYASGQFWMMNSLENVLSIFCIFLNLLFDNNIIHTSGQFWMINPLENALSFVCVCVCVSFFVFFGFCFRLIWQPLVLGPHDTTRHS